MAVSVRIPTPLRGLVGGQSSLEANGQSIYEVFQDLDSRYPGLLKKVYDGKDFHRFLNVYLNEEDIRFLQKENTPVRDGDRISIIPAIAGGMGRGR